MKEAAENARVAAVMHGSEVLALCWYSRT